MNEEKKRAMMNRNEQENKMVTAKVKDEKIRWSRMNEEEVKAKMIRN